MIIGKICSHKEIIQELEKLKDLIERGKTIRRILYVSLSLNGCLFLTRGGAELVNVEYILCNVEKGLRYLDDDQLKKIIHDL